MTELEQQAVESYNAALAHARAGRVADARTLYERAIALRPGYVRALNNLGTLLDDAGEHSTAERHYRAAIAAEPVAPEPWASLGSNLRAQGRLGEARAAYERALELRREFPAARWNLATIDLAEGRFAEGWVNYLFRPSVDRARAPLVELPADLTGIVVEIVDEQGLGDALFFARFVPALRARGAAVCYRADPRLAGILARAIDFGDVTGDAPVIRAALGDLPFLLGETGCPPSARAAPLPERVEAMRRVLRAAGPPPYIGLTWRAGRHAEGALFKEVPADRLGQSIRKVRGTLVDVQRAPAAGEHAAVERAAERPVADLSGRNDDLEDMLALMELLDDYVAVSNTNIHLRAAAGRRARVLVAHPADYRWMAEGSSSPWFPGFPLYRQAPGSWDAALTRVADDLGR